MVRDADHIALPQRISLSKRNLHQNAYKNPVLKLGRNSVIKGAVHFLMRNIDDDLGKSFCHCVNFLSS